MPTIWEKDVSKVAVTKEELVPFWFPSLGALTKRIQRDKNQHFGIKRLQRACKNNEMLIDFDSLDVEIQNALGDPRKVNNQLERFYVEDGSARMFYTQEFKFENGNTLKSEYIKEYTINASVLNALDSYKQEHLVERNQKGRKPKKLLPMLLELSNDFQEVLKLKFGYQHTLPGAERQFRTVYSNYILGDNRRDYLSLISGRLQNENARVLTSRTMQLLESLFAGSGNKPTKRKVFDKYQLFLDGLIEVVNNDTGEVYNADEFKPLSERTVTNFLSTWTSKIGTYNKRGADRQKLMESFSTPHSLKLPTLSGSLLSIDDRQPPFEYAPSQRLWAYNGVDVASRMITVTVVGKTKEGIMLEFYRQLVRNYNQWGFNIPYELEAEVSLNNSFKDTFLCNGAMFEKVRMIANSARGKYIERINKELRHDLEKNYELWKGRPHAIDENAQPMSFDNIYKKEQYRTYESLVQQTYQVVSDWNNLPHPEKPEISKWEYFKTHQNTNLKPTNWRGFLPHLGYATKTSCDRGRFTFRNNFYLIAENNDFLFGRELLNKMEIIEGENVMIYWLDGNDGEIIKALVYYNGEYVCEAKEVPRWQRAEAERTDQDLINQQIQAKYVATVEAFKKERTRSIEQVTIISKEQPKKQEEFVMPGYKKYVPIENDAEILEDPEELEILPITNNRNTNNTLLKSF